jgi:ribosomal protein S19E (S16A)
MAEYKPQAVKDVPANDFIKAYAAHLKSTDKVSKLQPSHTWSSGQRRLFQQQDVSDAALE